MEARYGRGQSSGRRRSGDPAVRRAAAGAAQARRSRPSRGSIRTKCGWTRRRGRSLPARSSPCAAPTAARSGWRCSTRTACSPRACSTATPAGRSAGGFSRAGSSGRCGCASSCSTSPITGSSMPRPTGCRVSSSTASAMSLVVQSNAAGMARLEPLVARRARRLLEAAGDRAAQRQPGARPGGAAARDAGGAGRPRRSGCWCARTARYSRSTRSPGRRPAGSSTSATTAALSRPRPGRRACPRPLLLHRRVRGAGGARPAPPRSSASTVPSRRWLSPARRRR